MLLQTSDLMLLMTLFHSPERHVILQVNFLVIRQMSEVNLLSNKHFRTEVNSLEVLYLKLLSPIYQKIEKFMIGCSGKYFS